MTDSQAPDPENTPNLHPAGREAQPAGATDDEAPRVDPTVAVNEAAERAKDTASRNIPVLGGLPVPDDTANLRQGPNLHDALLALLPLVGVWRGEGQAETDRGQFTFGQQITIAHDGGDYLTYDSRTWALDDNGATKGPDHRERGIWRISEDDTIEVLLTHSDGFVEVYYGTPLNERAWELSTDAVLSTPTGPERGAAKRLYGLVEHNDLGWVEERVNSDGALVPRYSARLQRFAG